MLSVLEHRTVTRPRRCRPSCGSATFTREEQDLAPAMYFPRLGMLLMGRVRYVNANLH